MPFYDYSCPKCGKEAEIFKSVKDCNREEICSECNEVLKRTIESYGCSYKTDCEDFCGKFS